MGWRKKYNKITERLKFLFDRYGYLSYAHEGEDLVIRKLLNNPPRGFYVDVGAYHPKRFSNTYIFYQHEWRGINIDATPGSMHAFRKTRPRDINLEIPISDEQKTVIFHEFDNPPLNSLSADLAHQRDQEGAFKIVAEHQLQTRTLASVLDEFLPEGQSIDFLTVDVEGMDLAVLKSNNWQKYRPHLVLVEELSFDGIRESKIGQFLGQQGYSFIAKTDNTVFYSIKH